jgi:hypothetical protein
VGVVAFSQLTRRKLSSKSPKLKPLDEKEQQQPLIADLEEESVPNRGVLSTLVLLVAIPASLRNYWPSKQELLLPCLLANIFLMFNCRRAVPKDGEKNVPQVTSL